MAGFWEYESLQERRARQAQEWQRQARRGAGSLVLRRTAQAQGVPEDSIYSPPSLMDKQLIRPQDLQDVFKYKTKQKSVLGKTFEAIDDASSAAFMGKVRQPWDLLRPVQRLFEAENKHISKPLAKILTAPLPGDYEDIPGIFRMTLETMLSPSTYVPLGAAGKLGRLSTVLGAQSGMGSMASRRALLKIINPRDLAIQSGAALGASAGAELARQSGVSELQFPAQAVGGILGGGLTSRSVRGRIPEVKEIAIPDWREPMETGSGLMSRFRTHDDLPGYPYPDGTMSAGGMSQWFRGDTELHIRNLSPTEQKYEISILRRGDSYSNTGKGTDPNLTDLLEVRDVIDDLLENNPDATFLAYPTDARRSRIYQKAGFRPSSSPVRVPHGPGVLELDRGRFRSNRNRSVIDSYRAGIIDPTDPEMQRILKAEEESILSAFNGPNKRQKAQRFRRELEDAYNGSQLIAKMKDGTATAAEIRQAQRILKRVEQRRAPYQNPKQSKGIMDEGGDRMSNLERKETEIAYKIKSGRWITLNEPIDVEQASKPVEQARMGYREHIKGENTKALWKSLDEMSVYAEGMEESLKNADSATGIRLRSLIEENRLQKADIVAELESRGEFDLQTRKPQWDRGARPTQFGAGAAAAMPESLVRMLTRLDDAQLAGIKGADDFAAKSTWEVLNFASQHRSATEKLRGKAAEWLPDPVVSWLEQHKVRLQDSEISDLIEYWKEKMDLGFNYAAVLGEQVDSAIRHGSIPTREIAGMGTIIDDVDLVTQGKALGLTDKAGNLYLDEMILNKNKFKLTPEQEATVQAIVVPLKQRLELEDIFELGYNKTAPNGEYVHVEPISRRARSNGDYIQTRLGPVVSRRIGARQTAGKSSPFTHAQGVDNGESYLSFGEAQSARVAQGYKAMADKYLLSQLEAYGKKPVDLLPPDLVTAHSKAAKINSQAEKLDGLLSYAIKTKSKRAWWPPKFSPVPELQQIILDAGQAATMNRQADRVAAWEQVRRELKAIMDPNKVMLTDLQAQRAKVLSEIASGRSPLTEEFPTQFKGRYFGATEGKELQALEKSNIPGGIEGLIQETNQQIRPIMASFDLSFLGVQGLVALFGNPGAYMKTMKTLVQRGYDDYFESLYKTGELDDMIKHGLHVMTRNDFAEFIVPQRLQNLPVAGAGFRYSNKAFTHFGNILRTEIYRNGLRAGMDEAAKRQLARTANLVSGFSPGDSTQIEKTFLFASRFFRSQLGLISDAVSKGDLTSAGAARHLGQFLVLGTMATYLANESLGQSTDFRPFIEDGEGNKHPNPNFLRVRVGDKDVSIFGTWDSLARAVNTLVTDGPTSATWYLARSKASPVISKAYDIIEGESLSGTEMDFSSPEGILKTAAESARTSFLPISVQSAIENGIPTTPGEAAGSAVQFIGTKATPLSSTEKLQIKQDELANKFFGASWNEIEPYQQFQLRQQYDLDSKSESEIAKAFDLRQTISGRYQGQQELIDSRLPVGKEWITAYQNLRREQTGAYAQWAESFPDAADRMRQGKGTNAQDQIRQQYFLIFDQADREDWTPDELSDALESFDATLTPAQRDYIERNTGLRNTPRVKEYKAASKVLRPYWNFEDQVWDRLKSRLPNASKTQTLQEWTNGEILRMQQAGVPDQIIVRRIQSNPVLRQIDRATQTLRLRYRRTHPNVDRLLVQWYGYQPIAG